MPGAEGTKKYEKTFDVIVSQVDPSCIETLAPVLGSALSVDAENASYILRSAPIVLMHGVAKSDLRGIKKRLMDLSTQGAEFTITTQAAPSLPRVVWAHRPKFSEGAGGEALTEVRFDLGNNAFVCASCGETYLFRRVGNLARKLTVSTATEEPVKAAAAPAPAPAKGAKATAAPPPPREEEPLEAVVPLESIEMLEKGSIDEDETEPAPAKKGGRGAPAAPAKRPPAKAKEEVEEVEEAEELAEVEEAEELEEIEPAMEVSPDDLDEEMDLGGEEEEAAELPELEDSEEEAEEVEETEEAEEAEEVEEADEIEEVAELDDLEESEEEEEEEETAPRASGRGRGPAATKEKAPARAPARAPVKPAADSDDEDGEGDGDDVQFSVFLSRIPTPDKQNQAAKLISEIRGVSMAEAKELASRMVIPVLKDVPKGEAEKCLEKFKKIKVSGRMTKKK